MTSSQEVILRVQDLRQSFLRPGQLAFSALSGLSFELHRGEFVAVLGTSGAGKTTLLRCLAGLQRPDSGQIVFADAATDLSRCGFIFQSPVFFPSQRVIDAVLIGGVGKKSTLRSWIENGLHFYQVNELAAGKQILDLVGIGDLAEQRVGKLSGGQRQRVAIARALYQNPAILLADEPVSQLDPLTAKQILALLKQICRTTQLSIFCNLHAPELAAQYADRVIGLKQGKIEFDLSAQQFRQIDLDRFYSSQESET